MVGDSIKLVTTRDKHQDEVVDKLRELLADAEAGEVVALCGVAEYKTHYRTVKTGMRNVYSMAGALFVAAQACAEPDR